MSSDSPVPPEPTPDADARAAAPPPAEPVVPLTRAGALWTFLGMGFFMLIVLLVFIVQNPATASFTFLAWHWRLPLGVAILLAAVGGGLLTLLVGTARMYQLRRATKKLNAGR